jgi:uncharacterized protein
LLSTGPRIELIMCALRLHPRASRLGVRLLLIAVLTGCSVLPGNGERQPSGHAVIASCGTQGVYYAYAGTLAQRLEEAAPGLDVEVASTAGSVDNLHRLAAGNATFAFTAADVAADAVNGAPPFGRRLPLAAVSRVYDDYMHLVVSASSPIRTLRDLAGRTVSIGPSGSGTAVIVERLFMVAGLEPRSVHAVQLGINESVDTLRKGEVDAFFWSGGLPTSGVQSLSDDMPLRLVPLGGLAPGMQDKFGSVYHQAAVPGGTYGLADQVDTIAVPNFLVCRGDTDPALVRLVVATLFRGREIIASAVPAAGALDGRTAIQTGPVRLHQAAAGWFRDTKP